MGAPLSGDARGYESHFATNRLGHFQLTARLWPALRRANGARVVTVSSWGHRYSDVHFDDPNFEHRDYEPLSAYGQSKTANVLFAVALDMRGQDGGCERGEVLLRVGPGVRRRGVDWSGGARLCGLVLAFRSRVAPIWVAWLGIVDTIAFVVASYAVATTDDAIAGVGFAAFILWAI